MVSLSPQVSRKRRLIAKPSPGAETSSSQSHTEGTLKRKRMKWQASIFIAGLFISARVAQAQGPLTLCHVNAYCTGNLQNAGLRVSTISRTFNFKIVVQEIYSEFCIPFLFVKMPYLKKASPYPFSLTQPPAETSATTWKSIINSLISTIQRLHYLSTKAVAGAGSAATRLSQWTKTLPLLELTPMLTMEEFV